VIKNLAFDAAGYDGMRLVVKGDGNRYKFRLKVKQQTI
jgi:Complex I intermediate-associated protein 30 (CIA30)